MNPMLTKTPEERRAIAAKAHATRRNRRIAKQEESAQENLQLSDARCRLAEIEARIQHLERMETLSLASARIFGKGLLLTEDIVAASQAYEVHCGVYFLIYEGRVVYVGQSVDVLSRISQHKEKRFDRFAFVPCDRASLDVIESLYIHILQPPLNGEQTGGGKSAPIGWEALQTLIVAASDTRALQTSARAPRRAHGG